ncbi:endonuclease [Virgibacillus necropolis]|uniref:endonuclease I family protein n=1 Tax=Virgibacillus necropolis TaxID=163877 RepID=UPI00384F1154
MTLTTQQKERFLPVTTDPQRLNTIISKLSETKRKLEKDDKVYYDDEKDKQTIEQYYRSIDFEKLNDDDLTQLLKETHTNKLRYDPSEYVYPWVDLRPDGNLVSIYSGQKREAEDVIKEDHETSLKREQEAEKAVDADKDQDQVNDQLAQIENDFKYNCEHSVPQSWFNEQEPMRGDLHHLFTCDPVCNSIRSNYPYHDFTNYAPEKLKVNRIEEACGKADEELFEPEYGKGTVARAMLYFLVRYPDQIEQTYKEEIDTKLLLNWHHSFPPNIYEKHRNQAIFEIQGNRNPFIDFPEKVNLLPK